MRTASEGPAVDAGCSDRRGCDGWVSRRDGRTVRRIAAIHRINAVHLPARFHLLGTPGNASRNDGRTQFPIRVRKDRNRVLRDLANEKNVAFRQSLLGREFTAVTLDPPGLALTDNYVKATLDVPYTPNRLIRVRPRSLSDQGVSAQIVATLG